MSGQKKKKVLLAVLTGILVFFAAAAAFVFVSGKMKEKSYSEAIKSAEKYLAQNNYEDAVVAYKKAISLNPEDENTYLDLAEVYVKQGELSKAKSILRKGEKETGSIKIRRMLDSLETQTMTEALDAGEKEQEAPVDLRTASQNIGWNTSFLQKLTSYHFEDYRDEFGSVKDKQEEGGYMEIRHTGLNGVCCYRNTDQNPDIVDESRNTPTEEGMPELVRLDHLGLLFRNFEGGVSIDRLQMLVGEKITPKKAEERYYLEIKMEDCLIHIGTDEAGNITSSGAWNEILLPNANKKKSSAGALSGVVVDAMTGEGVSGAVLTFQPEDKAGQEKTAAADASGVFTVELDPGVYQISIKAEEYIEEKFGFVVEKGRTYSGEQFSISPELTKGTARIVLEWNAEPQDLDSYLRGTTDQGDRVAVSFRNKQSMAGNDLIAELDLDDTDGYGPETVTIYDLDGVYEFTVADFRRTLTMAQYGATVKVYLPDQEPAVITLDPEAGVKDIWIVCELDHGELNIINEAPAQDQFTPGNK